MILRWVNGIVDPSWVPRSKVNQTVIANFSKRWHPCEKENCAETMPFSDEPLMMKLKFCSCFNNFEIEEDCSHHVEHKSQHIAFQYTKNFTILCFVQLTKMQSYYLHPRTLQDWTNRTIVSELMRFLNHAIHWSSRFNNSCRMYAGINMRSDQISDSLVLN